MTLAASSDLLRYASNALEVLLIARLIHLKLALHYAAFTAFLFCNAAFALTAAIPVNSHTYLAIWYVASPLVWTFQILLIYGLYRDVCNQYPNLGDFADRLLFYCFIPAAALGLLIALLPSTDMRHWPFAFRLTLPAARFVAATSFLLLLAQQVFFLLFPIPLQWNIRVHRALITVYFLCLSVTTYFGFIWNRRVEQWANAASAAIACLCYLCWLTLLRKEAPAIMHTVALMPADPVLDAEFRMKLAEADQLSSDVFGGRFRS